ncbi:MAG: hypothetical protein V1810_00295 [Candidatus Beckwithbacteria bacterium]
MAGSFSEALAIAYQQKFGEKKEEKEEIPEYIKIEYNEKAHKQLSEIFIKRRIMAILKDVINSEFVGGKGEISLHEMKSEGLCRGIRTSLSWFDRSSATGILSIYTGESSILVEGGEYFLEDFPLASNPNFTVISFEEPDWKEKVQKEIITELASGRCLHWEGRGMDSPSA